MTIDRPSHPPRPGRYLVVGGAGFIGSHVVEALLAAAAVERVTIFDDFSSGTRGHVAHLVGDPRLAIVEADAADLGRLEAATAGHDTVVHLASNPDIARAAVDPDVDFRLGTALTRNVLEAMRRSGARELLYASGSGVYGDLGAQVIGEDHGPLLPISTYGASKLAGEAMICAYCHMAGLRGRAFRFGNVVGPRQTHGVALDFIRRLRRDPTRLEVLGDGSQSKPYIHVADVVEALFVAQAADLPAYACFNVATDDAATVREIAGLVLAGLGLDPAAVELVFGTSDRGWRGDVPIVRLDSARIRALGWAPRRGARAALAAAIAALVREAAGA